MPLKIVLLFTTLFMSLVVWADPPKIEKFVVIVPVYRELYNQNIGSVLMALNNQNLDGLSFDQIEVVFVVNNTKDVDPTIRLENKETVKFLSDFAAGNSPTVPDEQRILQWVSRLKLSEKIKFKIMDLTTPGEPTRNIGKIRDNGLWSVLNGLSEAQMDNTLIAQMDADSSFRSSFVRTAVSAFEAVDLKFALLTMYYNDQTDSRAQVYQRKITTDYRAAGHSFDLAINGEMPGGGGPRIIGTARAYKQVGGVPHEVMGEDVALIQKLKTLFPRHGVYLENLVLANYRARSDSYDGAVYELALNYAIEFGDRELGATRHLNENQHRILTTPILRSLFEEAYQQELQEYLSSRVVLQNIIRILIQDILNGTVTIRPDFAYPVLINNSWFDTKLRSLVQEHGSDADAILQKLIAQFPYYLSGERDPGFKILTEVMRLRAAATAVLQNNFLNRIPIERDGTTDEPRYLQEFYKRYPITAQLVMQQREAALSEIQTARTAEQRRLQIAEQERLAGAERQAAELRAAAEKQLQRQQVEAMQALERDRNKNSLATMIRQLQNPDGFVVPGFRPAGTPPITPRPTAPWAAAQAGPLIPPWNPLPTQNSMTVARANERTELSQAPTDWPHDLLDWYSDKPYEFNVARAMGDADISDKLIEKWTGHWEFIRAEGPRLYVESFLQSLINAHLDPYRDSRQNELTMSQLRNLALRAQTDISTLMRRKLAQSFPELLDVLLRNGTDNLIRNALNGTSWVSDARYQQWEAKRQRPQAEPTPVAATPGPKKTTAPKNWPNDKVRWSPEHSYEFNVVRAMASSHVSQQHIDTWTAGWDWQNSETVRIVESQFNAMINTQLSNLAAWVRTGRKHPSYHDGAVYAARHLHYFLGRSQSPNFPQLLDVLISRNPHFLAQMVEGTTWANDSRYVDWRAKNSLPPSPGYSGPLTTTNGALCLDMFK